MRWEEELCSSMLGCLLLLNNRIHVYRSWEQQHIGHSIKRKTKQDRTKVLKADELGWNPKCLHANAPHISATSRKVPPVSSWVFCMIKGDYSLFSYMIPVEEVGVGGGHLDE